MIFSTCDVKLALFASDYNFEAIHESLNILCFVNFLIVIPMKINMRQILKNIPKEEVLRLADLIDVRPGEIVSKNSRAKRLRKHYAFLIRQRRGDWHPRFDGRGHGNSA